MHIGICEDNPHDLTRLINSIQKYPHFTQPVSFQIFNNADDLLQYISNPETKPLHCLLLDIFLPSMTGMTAAYRIRQYDKLLPIIFISSSPDFAVESYRIRAFDYLLKPFTLETITTLFDRLKKQLQLPDASFFLVKTTIGLRRISFKHLLYVEAFGRDIIYMLHDGEAITTRDTLTAVSKVLSAYPHFIKPHRSYIVNLAAIEQLNRQELVIKNNKKIPLARSSYENVKQRYINFCFEGDLS